jgi:hypothetical protein
MDNQRTFGQRTKSALTRFLIFIIVVALAGAVLWLLSRLNARTFAVEVVDNQLVVMKGRPFPIGMEPYRPADAQQKEAYAPIPLEGTSIGRLVEERFGDREELDRALFDVVARIASTRIASDDPQTLQLGLNFLRRAQKFSGLSEEQRATLKGMETDVAFYLARAKLDDARRSIAEAMAQLKIAAGAQNRHARSANQMMSEVQPKANALEEALRRAVHTLSAPATSSASAEPIQPPAVPPMSPDASVPN